ncbi:MAG: sulfurtransferase complex subunit TusB [Pseudomonadota bacterium]
MSTLYTIAKSPFAYDAVESCLAFVAEPSSVLFIEDAVYAVQDGTEVAALVDSVASKVRLYVLEADLNARGIEPHRRLSRVEAVGYSDFVRLATEHKRVVSWR